MKEIVKYMAFYPSYYETINLLPVEKRLSAYEIFLDYGLYGIEPDDSIDYELKLIFSMAKATIDSSTRNFLNGRKGGRPKKGDEEKEGKTPVKTTGKTPVKTKKENKREKEKEKEKDTPFTSLTLKEGETLPPSADAGGASTFTLTDCKECAKKGKVNLSEDGITAFYSRMKNDGWKIKDSPVTNLLLAMRGFAKNHKQYQKQTEQEENLKNEILKNFKTWLCYHGYGPDYIEGDGDFNEEISIDVKMMDLIWDVDSLSESMYSISKRLEDEGYDKEYLRKNIMLLFHKFSKEKEGRR